VLIVTTAVFTHVFIEQIINDDDDDDVKAVLKATSRRKQLRTRNVGQCPT